MHTSTMVTVTNFSLWIFHSAEPDKAQLRYITEVPSFYKYLGQPNS